MRSAGFARFGLDAGRSHPAPAGPQAGKQPTKGMAVADILGALQDAAAANPEKAQEVVADLKAKFDELTPEQQQQAMEKLGELRDKVANLSEDQKADIESFIRDKAGI